jgi:hypothetical protein
MRPAGPTLRPQTGESVDRAVRRRRHRCGRTVNLAAFLLATAVITLAGARLSGIADRLADRTGLGEALMASVLLPGLLRRERRGPGNFGAESVTMLGLYLLGVLLLYGTDR